MATKRFKRKITFNSDSDKLKKSNENEEISYIAHLQPEVLPLQLMKSLLLTRGGGKSIEDEESLEKITKLFYKHITPKPQREYKQNRKGKILTKLRNMAEKLISKTTTDAEWKIIKTDENTSHLSSSKDSDASQSRLKRPISCIDPERKKIKLKASAGSSFDQIKIINRKTVSMNSSEVKLEEIKDKSLQVKLEESKDKSPKVKLQETKDKDLEDKEITVKETKIENASETKKIKLERSNTQKSSDSPKEEPKKKSLISWP